MRTLWIHALDGNWLPSAAYLRFMTFSRCRSRTLRFGVIDPVGFVLKETQDQIWSVVSDSVKMFCWRLCLQANLATLHSWDLLGLALLGLALNQKRWGGSIYGNISGVVSVWGRLPTPSSICRVLSCELWRIMNQSVGCVCTHLCWTKESIYDYARTICIILQHVGKYSAKCRLGLTIELLVLPMSTFLFWTFLIFLLPVTQELRENTECLGFSRSLSPARKHHPWLILKQLSISET